MATILIADDEPDVRSLLQLTLRNRGHEVVLAESGEAALAAATRSTPDLVILDVNMPGMEGTQVARELRERPATARIPILFLTGLGGESDKLAGFAAGADDYVTKPFNPRELAARVTALLARGGGGGPTARPEGRLVVVAGPKGGAGRTTVAVNLAICAVQQRQARQRVILIDGSLALGDVATHLDLQPTPSILDLAPFAGRLDTPVLEGVLVKHRSGVEVLLRPPNAEDGERITSALLREVVGLAGALADLVIADLPAAYDDDRALALLEAASTIVLVVTPEIGALQNAHHFLSLAPRLGIDPSRARLVVNRMHGRVGLSEQDIAKALGVAPLGALPEIGPAATEHVNAGTPSVLASKGSDLSRGLQRLAESLVAARTAVVR